MLNFVAFLFAATLLVTVHEWGHYRMAVAFGVKVLRFSIGLGRPLWRWTKPHQHHGQNTELCVGWLPLGGFVMMLDARQGEIRADEVHQSFDVQPLWVRALIVASGPVVNLIFAALLLAAAAWWGQLEADAVLSTPTPQSAAQRAGLIGGERVLAVAAVSAQDLSDLPEASALVPIASYMELLSQADQALRKEQDLLLKVQQDGLSQPSSTSIRLKYSDTLPLSPGEKEHALQLWGVQGPRTQAQVTQVVSGGPADLAGLKSGDLVLKIDGQTVPDAQFVRQKVQQSATRGLSKELEFHVLRGHDSLKLTVTPTHDLFQGQSIGRIGVAIGSPAASHWVDHGVFESGFLGIQKAQAVIGLNLRMVVNLLLGQGSWDQVGGPLSIADQAGRSAQLGFAAFLGFLGFLSVSLGVLNLLPFPLLDGGHLMYYLWELLTGRPVSMHWVNRLQKVGLMMLVALMATVLVNDGIRLFR